MWTDFISRRNRDLTGLLTSMIQHSGKSRPCIIQRWSVDDAEFSSVDDEVKKDIGNWMNWIDSAIGGMLCIAVLYRV